MKLKAIKNIHSSQPTSLPSLNTPSSPFLSWESIGFVYQTAKEGGKRDNIKSKRKEEEKKGK